MICGVYQNMNWITFIGARAFYGSEQGNVEAKPEKGAPKFFQSPAPLELAGVGRSSLSRETDPTGQGSVGASRPTETRPTEATASSLAYSPPCGGHRITMSHST